MNSLPEYGDGITVPKHVLPEDVALLHNVRYEVIREWLDTHPQFEYTGDIRVEGLPVLINFLKGII